MSPQFSSIVRALLKMGGAAATALAVTNPAWGTVLQAAVGLGGAVFAAWGTAWGVVAAGKTS